MRKSQLSNGNFSPLSRNMSPRSQQKENRDRSPLSGSGKVAIFGQDSKTYYEEIQKKEKMRQIV